MASSTRAHERLIPLSDVVSRTCPSRSGIYAAMAGRTFPAPVKIGARPAWVEAETDERIEQRIAERDASDG